MVSLNRPASGFRPNRKKFPLIPPPHTTSILREKLRSEATPPLRIASPMAPLTNKRAFPSTNARYGTLPPPKRLATGSSLSGKSASDALAGTAAAGPANGDIRLARVVIYKVTVTNTYTNRGSGGGVSMIRDQMSRRWRRRSLFSGILTRRIRS